MSPSIEGRKREHLDLCANEDVGFRQRGTLLGEVRLIHQALPELALDQINTQVTLLGKTLRAPLLIAGMTGGTERAAAINRDLAAVAERRGYGFGLGSQRAMLRDPQLAETYAVRDVAPELLLLGNIGGVQARDMSRDALEALVTAVGADALCVHLNPAMELIQSGGDRDFRGVLASLERLASELSVPIIAKETGCGLSQRCLGALREAGIRHVDVSGAGGTSWVGVETLRAAPAAQALGEALWDWGIPTAVSVAWAARAKMLTIATGGLKRGLDVARAIALGATLGGIARPVLVAYETQGVAGVERYLDQVEAELRATMLLCGAADLAALRTAPRILGAELRHWMDDVGGA